MNKRTKLGEKATRIPDTREARWEEAVLEYLREVESLHTEPARPSALPCSCRNCWAKYPVLSRTIAQVLRSISRSEVYLKPAANYVQLAEPLNFYTVVKAAQQRGELALGYRLHAFANDAAKAYGAVLNPDKSALVTFSEKDRIIVLAEE